MEKAEAVGSGLLLVETPDVKRRAVVAACYLMNPRSGEEGGGSGLLLDEPTKWRGRR